MYVGTQGVGKRFSNRAAGIASRRRLGDDGSGFDWSALTSQLVNVGGSIAQTALAPSPYRTATVAAPTAAQIAGAAGSAGQFDTTTMWYIIAGIGVVLAIALFKK